MPIIKTVFQSRSISSGHAIELDFELNDNSTHTLQIPFERIPFIIHAITSAAALAEAQQKTEAGDPSVAVLVPYRVRDMRTGSSPDGLVVADFSTPQGPVQIAMTAALTRSTIERLTTELARLDTRQFPKPS